MAFNIDKDLNFGITGEKFNGMKHQYKKLNKRNREENIYGTFYGDLENILDPIENKEDRNNDYDQQIIKDNYLKLNFVKSQKTPGFIPTKSEVKIEDKNKEIISDEEVMEELLEDYSKETRDSKKFGNLSQDKNLEKTLSKKYGKGFDMLKKSGFKVGSGLGKDEQGITDPIKIKKRKKKVGISQEDKGSMDEEEKDGYQDESVYTKKDDYFLGKKKKIIARKKEEGRSEIDEFEQILVKWSKIKNYNLAAQDEIDIDEIAGINFGQNRKNEKDISFKMIDYYDFKKSSGEAIINSEGKYNIQINKFINLCPKNKQLSINGLINLIFPSETKYENTEREKEIMINLIKNSKEKVLYHLNSLKSTQDSSVYLNFEAKRILSETNKINDEAYRKNKFLKELMEFSDFPKENLQLNNKIFSPTNLTHTQNIHKFDYISYIKNFINLYENNKQEYLNNKELTFFCIHKIITRMKFRFNLEDYMKSNNQDLITVILDLIKNLIKMTFDDTNIFQENYCESDHIFSRPKNIYTYEEEEILGNVKVSQSEKIYGNFLNEIVIKDLINYIINIWNVKEYEKLLDVLKFYKEMIPKFLFDYLIESAVIPRLIEYSNENWNPIINTTQNTSSEKGNIPLYIHLWILPWLEILKLEKLNPIFKIIQYKIERNIVNWDVMNLDSINILKPWRRLWDENYFEDIVNKYILPKLNYIMSKFIIDPRNQSLSNLKILLKWNNEILNSDEKIISILKKHFFPKWLDTLQKWLVDAEITEVKINEIQKWYEGWKNYFTKNNLMNYDVIKTEFKNAMMLIFKFAKN
jgi:hypothetical protein